MPFWFGFILQSEAFLLYYCFVVNHIVIYAKYHTSEQHLHANIRFSRLEIIGQFCRARVSVFVSWTIFLIALLRLFISQLNIHVDHLSASVLKSRHLNMCVRKDQSLVDHCLLPSCQEVQRISGHSALPSWINIWGKNAGWMKPALKNKEWKSH